MSQTYGVLLRVYTPKAEEVPGRVERAMEHVARIRAVSADFPALQHVALLVPSDHDCGETASALHRRLLAESIPDVAVWALPGHHSCEVLNGGVNGLQGKDTYAALIISGKAMPYLTSAVMRGIDEAFSSEGALVSGLAVDELRDIVLGGCPQNTFAAWVIGALTDVGGFDSRTGVEEIAPLVRLVQKNGPCIAPLDTAGGALDIAQSETARARHLEVMTTKLARQQQELKRVGSSFEEIKSGIMSGYPRPV